VAQHWRAYFPRQLSQSAFNRRARDLWGLLAALGPLIAAWVRDHLGLPRAEYEVIDGVPVLLVRGCRGQRHPLFGLVAAFGRGGADKARYFGSKLLVSVGATPLIWGAVVGPANTEERWLLEALLTWRCAPTLPLVRPEELASVLGPAHRQQGQRQGPTGWLGPRYAAGSWGPGVYYGDLNYTGAAWQRHWTAAYEVTVATKAEVRSRPAATRALVRRFNSLRQVVERVNGLLETVFGLHFPRAFTVNGLWARLAAKLAACNCLVGLNLLLGRPPETRWSPFI
jgi:hypothetical protein